MIPEIKDSTLVTNQDQGEAFQIEANQFMFDLLSSGLYTKKEEAIVRELCCNARDSHKMAGNDEPFKIIMPSSFDPTLTIQDFGVGLSEDQVDKVYRVYGASDKRTSNDTIGGLGVGSKAPFCYATSFTVESVYDGVWTQYSAYIDEQSRPRIAKVHSELTNDSNGVSIKIPVKVGDIYKFRNAVRKVYSWLDLKPEVISEDTLELEDKTFSEDYLINKKGYGYSLQVLMGGVLYDCNFIELQQSPLFIAGSIIKADIGELAFAASRESIANTDSTKKKVLDKVRKIEKTLLETIQAEIDKCLYMTDVFSEDFIYPERLVKMFEDKLTWKGEPLSNVHFKTSLLTPTGQKKEFVVKPTTKTPFEVLVVDYPKYKRFVASKIGLNKVGCVDAKDLVSFEKSCNEAGVNVVIHSLKHYVENKGIKPSRNHYTQKERNIGHPCSVVDTKGTIMQSMSVKDVCDLVENNRDKTFLYIMKRPDGYSVQSLPKIYPEVVVLCLPSSVIKTKSFNNLKINKVEDFLNKKPVKKKIEDLYVAQMYVDTFRRIETKYLANGLRKEVIECFEDKDILRKYSINKRKFKYPVGGLVSILGGISTEKEKLLRSVSCEVSNFSSNFYKRYPLIDRYSSTFGKDQIIYIKAKHSAIKKGDI